MYTNVNLAAPIGALALLGTGFLFLVVGLAFVYTLATRKFRANKFVLAVATLIAIVYLGIFMLFSLSSRKQVLSRSQENHYCEIDCHLAYSLTAKQKKKTLGTGPH